MTQPRRYHDTVPAGAPAATIADPASTSALWEGHLPTLGDVYRARNVVWQHLRPTPLIHAEALSDRIGIEIHVKCENLHPVGAFKVRGGVYLMSRLPEAQRRAGVVGASTGNHGQSIAWAARAFGAQATIFVPEVANPLKVASMERLGARVVNHGPDFDAAFHAAQRFAEETGAHFIHSADEPDLIAGVGTASLEIMEAQPDLDALFVPIGGGSGLCGACIVGKTLNPDLQVIGVQAEGAPVVRESWLGRELRQHDTVATFSEGLATRVAFRLPAAILWDRVDDIMLVSDAEMRRGMLTVLESLHMVAESAGAAALAGLMRRREEFQGKRVAVMLSGGNVTIDGLMEAMSGERPW